MMLYRRMVEGLLAIVAGTFRAHGRRAAKILTPGANLRRGAALSVEWWRKDLHNGRMLVRTVDCGVMPHGVICVVRACA